MIINLTNQKKKDQTRIVAAKIAEPQTGVAVNVVQIKLIAQRNQAKLKQAIRLLFAIRCPLFL
jgi:hypothetical protein